MRNTFHHPTMDEWLLNTWHGLHDRDNQDNAADLRSSDFLNPEVYQFFKAINSKPKSATKAEKITRQTISKIIWPRLLLVRCRKLMELSLKLADENYFEYALDMLDDVRKLLLLTGFIIHGLRLFINLMTVINPSQESSAQLENIWFQLVNDTHWLISALTPSSWVIFSILSIVLDLALIAVHSWIEIERLETYQKLFEAKLKSSSLPREATEELIKAKFFTQKLLDHKMKKIILSLGVSLSSLSLCFIKHFILPTLFTSIATHPITPIGFAVVSLSITIANHIAGKNIERNNPITKYNRNEKNPWRDLEFFYKPENKKNHSPNQVNAELIRL